MHINIKQMHFKLRSVLKTKRYIHNDEMLMVAEICNVDTYELNNRAPKAMNQQLTELEEETDK